jgi:fructose-bisphosphate aldolase class II
MPLVHMGDMLRHAYEHRYTVGAFDVPGLDLATGVVAAAEARRSPAILRLDPCACTQDAVAPLVTAMERSAEQARVPLAIQLDSGDSPAAAGRAVNLGASALRVDARDARLDDNIARTREVASLARACGVPVEGALDASSLSGGEDARRYLRETGVDALGLPGAGSAHGGRADTGAERRYLAETGRVLGVPLGLCDHGVPDPERFHRLATVGVAKIDFRGLVANAATAYLRARVVHPAVDFTSLGRGVADAVAAVAVRCMDSCGSASRADDVLTACRPWTPLEHVILYNTRELDGAGVQAMMDEGRRVLGAIPGVRRVFAGHAVQPDAAYRHCWVVRFAARPVIAGYRDHPDHLRFADEHFRPYAGDRVSIDFEGAG